MKIEYIPYTREEREYNDGKNIGFWAKFKVKGYTPIRPTMIRFIAEQNYWLVACMKI